ncbi:MAG: glutaredoxin domain-containing protein [Chloroflexia bacterium]
MAKKFLSQRGIAYRERDVSRDQAAAAEMVARSGQFGVPVIVVGDQVIVGFDRTRLERALARVAAQRPRLGARVAATRTLPGERWAVDGAYVAHVLPGSPAEAAGLREGDIIVRLAGARVQGPDEIEQRLQEIAPGQTAEIVWIREGKEMRGHLRF